MVFLFGITIGSFLNVCIYRIPRKEDIVLERSHCMSCGNVLKWYELIPVISFLIQGGKCRSCKTKLSMQYPLIELANGLIYIWIFAVKGFGLESVLFCACASTLIVISMIDFRTYEIPFGCNLVILALGAVRLILDLPHWYDYVIGFFTVSGIFMIIYWITRGNGIGGGDIKLMAAAGLLLGWKEILLALVIGSGICHSFDIDEGTEKRQSAGIWTISCTGNFLCNVIRECYNNMVLTSVFLEQRREMTDG